MNALKEIGSIELKRNGFPEEAIRASRIISRLPFDDEYAGEFLNPDHERQSLDVLREACDSLVKKLPSSDVSYYGERLSRDLDVLERTSLIFSMGILEIAAHSLRSIEKIKAMIEKEEIAPGSKESYSRIFGYFSIEKIREQLSELDTLCSKGPGCQVEEFCREIRNMLVENLKWQAYNLLIIFLTGNHTDVSVFEQYMGLIQDHKQFLSQVLLGASAQNLFVTIRNNNAQATKLLLSLGADPNYWGTLNHSPLHEICGIRANLDILQILLKYGADPYRQDGNGETCFDLARKANFVEILRILDESSSKISREPQAADRSKGRERKTNFLPAIALLLALVLPLIIFFAYRKQTKPSQKERTKNQKTTKNKPSQ